MVFRFWVLFSIALPFDLATSFSYHLNFSHKNIEKKGFGIHNRKIEGLWSEFLYCFCLLVRLFCLVGICNLQIKATCRHWSIVWTWGLTNYLLPPVLGSDHAHSQNVNLTSFDWGDADRKISLPPVIRKSFSNIQFTLSAWWSIVSPFEKKMFMRQAHRTFP